MLELGTNRGSLGSRACGDPRWIVVRGPRAALRWTGIMCTSRMREMLSRWGTAGGWPAGPLNWKRMGRLKQSGPDRRQRQVRRPTNRPMLPCCALGHAFSSYSYPGAHAIIHALDSRALVEHEPHQLSASAPLPLSRSRHTHAADIYCDPRAQICTAILG